MVQQLHLLTKVEQAPPADQGAAAPPADQGAAAPPADQGEQLHLLTKVEVVVVAKIKEGQKILLFYFSSI